jgi:hypothetical protein
MKKIIPICAIAIFAFSACKKENTGEVNYTPQTDSKKIEALILDFKDKLDNTLKDGTTYAADSAVWYVEALLNYSYGYATALGCIFETDSVGTTVNTGGSNAYTLEQLNYVYQYLEEEATGNIPDDTYIFCIDVSLAVTGNQSTFSSVSAYAKQFLPNYKSAADTSGYWYWGDELGMCDPDSGLYIGMDATDIIEASVNATAEYDYFTNLVGYGVLYPNEYYDPNFPFTDPYLLPYRYFVYYDSTGPNADFCLSPDHMAYYSGNSGALYMVKDKKPTNRVFACCYVTYLSYGVPDLDKHVWAITYGSPIERP